MSSGDVHQRTTGPWAAVEPCVGQDEPFRKLRSAGGDDPQSPRSPDQPPPNDPSGGFSLIRQIWLGDPLLPVFPSPPSPTPAPPPSPAPAPPPIASPPLPPLPPFSAPAPPCASAPASPALSAPPPLAPAS